MFRELFGLSEEKESDREKRDREDLEKTQHAAERAEEAARQAAAEAARMEQMRNMPYSIALMGSMAALCAGDAKGAEVATAEPQQKPVQALPSKVIADSLKKDFANTVQRHAKTTDEAVKGALAAKLFSLNESYKKLSGGEDIALEQQSRVVAR